jgi:hypothetical protein
MEIIDAFKYDQFKMGPVLKEVPITTDQTMATILLIDSSSHTKDLNHPQEDRLCDNVKVEGEVAIGNESRQIRKVS